NPVEHDPRPVGPVPVEADGQVVVLATAEVRQVEVRPAGLRFPRSPADAAGDGEEVGKRLVPTELGSVLSKALEDAVLAGEEVAEVRVGAADADVVAVPHVDIADEGFVLQ